MEKRKPKVTMNEPTCNNDTSQQQNKQQKLESPSIMLQKLRATDTASLCDADKSIRSKSTSEMYYEGLSVMNTSMKLMTKSSSSSPPKLVGVARTVQCTQPNDFLAILQGLHDSQPGDVLMVNTMNSTRAVAGGLFVTESNRRGLSGLIVDGPVRDLIDMNSALSKSGSVFPCYATSKTPYSGTVGAVGKTQVPIICGGVMVNPGDWVVGDEDGVIVGSPSSFAAVIDFAMQIQQSEEKVMNEMKLKGRSLFEMINYDDHLKKRKKGEESNLVFKNLDL